MRKLSKVGLALFVVGVGVYCWPFVRFGYPTQIPVSAPISLDAGAVFRQEFAVRTGRFYSLDLSCREGPPFNFSSSDFLSSGSSAPTIPCNMDIQVSKAGKVIQSEHLESLRPSSYFSSNYYWHLAYLTLPSAGHYSLTVTNRSDLSSLKPTSPLVRMDIGGVFYVNAIFSKLLALVIAVPLCLIGIVMFLWGLRRPAAVSS